MAHKDKKKKSPPTASQSLLGRFEAAASRVGALTGHPGALLAVDARKGKIRRSN